jgi:accessory gene regulator protein AgrB
MFTILICLAHTFLPNAATLVAQVEISATVMSVAVFGFIAYQSRRSNSRPSAQPHNDVSFVL